MLINALCENNVSNIKLFAAFNLEMQFHFGDIKKCYRIRESDAARLPGELGAGPPDGAAVPSESLDHP